MVDNLQTLTVQPVASLKRHRHLALEKSHAFLSLEENPSHLHIIMPQTALQHQQHHPHQLPLRILRLQSLENNPDIPIIVVASQTILHGLT
jgi:hypothetical protein